MRQSCFHLLNCKNGVGVVIRTLLHVKHLEQYLMWGCYAECPNPRAGREKASKTVQHAKKGKFIADSSQDSCRNQHSGAGSESPEPMLLSKFIGCA